MTRLRLLKSTFQNNMNENITLMIRINWIWHSQLHITADMRLQPKASAQILSSLGLLISAKRYTQLTSGRLNENKTLKKGVIKCHSKIRNYRSDMILL